MYRQLVMLVCSLLFIRCLCDTHLDNVLSALEKVMNYVVKNKEYMNLDAVFCIVLAQAQIAYITSHNKSPLEFQRRILDVEQNLSSVLMDTRKLLEPTRKNTLFVHTVLSVEAWDRNITFKKQQLPTFDCTVLRKVNTYSKYVNYLASSDFESQKSDDCMMELLQQQRYCCVSHKCIVSHECYRTMGLNTEEKINPAYGVTHSLLFLQLARSQLCVMNERLLAQKIERFCSYIYWELLKNADYGFLAHLDDLLLEQVTLCGMEGYAEFFSNDIIEHIVATQSPSGCFTNGDPEDVFEDVEESKRKKRESSLLSDGCIDHTTGLGVSALALCLRYLLQINQKESCDYPDY